uniref:Uncharacterized protein n=1 Tax=Ditylenchus dipsaci TaxID=166011 RepID=A0A915DMF2_9BILA
MIENVETVCRSTSDSDDDGMSTRLLWKQDPRPESIVMLQAVANIDSYFQAIYNREFLSVYLNQGGILDDYLMSWGLCVSPMVLPHQHPNPASPNSP